MFSPNIKLTLFPPKLLNTSLTKKHKPGPICAPGKKQASTAGTARQCACLPSPFCPSCDVKFSPVYYMYAFKPRMNEVRARSNTTK